MQRSPLRQIRNFLVGKNFLFIKNAASTVSFGLQSADNTELKKSGRIHSFEESLKSFQSAEWRALPIILI